MSKRRERGQCGIASQMCRKCQVFSTVMSKDCFFLCVSPPFFGAVEVTCGSVHRVRRDSERHIEAFRKGEDGFGETLDTIHLRDWRVEEWSITRVLEVIRIRLEKDAPVGRIHDSFMLHRLIDGDLMGLDPLDLPAFHPSKFEELWKKRHRI